MNTPKQDLAVSFVKDNPGCCKLAVAEYVGPNGSRKFGYRIVDRAIKAGRIRAQRKENGTYVLTIP